MAFFAKEIKAENASSVLEKLRKKYGATANAE